jgi:Rad3-related DNA helicase
LVLTVNNFRTEAQPFLFSRLNNGRNVLIDAPPGLGKTRTAAKVAIQLVKESGKRVLIIEPTKTLRTSVSEYIQKEDAEIAFHISKAWGDYKCPLNQSDADLCSVRKDQCREEKVNCGVLDDIDKTLKSNLTIATFSKFLLSKAMFREYDTIIIDESHGFENAESSYLQTYLMFDKLNEVSKELAAENPELANKLANLLNGLSRMNSMLGDSTPLASREVEIIRKELSDTSLRDAWIAFTRDNKHPRFNALYRNIANLNYLMTSVSSHVFFFYKGSLFGRPKNMEAEISGFFKDKNVCLLSATIDNPVYHARSCGLDMRRFNDIDGVILKDYPAVRRQNRKLIALKDGPILGRSGGEYDDFRIQANEIIATLLEKFVVRTLVLFRGYNDQQEAWKFLQQRDFSQRIHNVWRGDDPDVIDEKIKKLRESDIVLSSAAARLWEGVDIPELRLVIIDALPYPSKDPLDKEYDFRVGYYSMIKKLKQGLGRIVRSDDDWGAALVIDRRFANQSNRLGPRLPWFMGDDFKLLSFDESLNEIAEFIKTRAV